MINYNYISIAAMMFGISALITLIIDIHYKQSTDHLNIYFLILTLCSQVLWIIFGVNSGISQVVIISTIYIAVYVYFLLLIYIHRKDPDNFTSKLPEGVVLPLVGGRAALVGGTIPSKHKSKTIPKSILLPDVRTIHSTPLSSLTEVV